LGADGWYFCKESQDGSITSEGPRTVIQAARETEQMDMVLSMTEDALKTKRVHPVAHAKVSDELAAAQRAVADGNL
jgi:hypothetical protein